MTRPRVKICGMMRLEDARLAAALGADAVGFILWPHSPRGITPEQARPISDALPAFVTRVGVFVNTPPREVEHAVRIARLDAVQLHGDEDVALYRDVAPHVIRALPLDRAEDLVRVEAVPVWATVLVDAADRERRGGTGRRANWDLAAQAASRRPTILAGGLDPETVGAALAHVRPWAVDVSSGVEAAPGRKDEGKMRAFCAAVAAASGAAAAKEDRS